MYATPILQYLKKNGQQLDLEIAAATGIPLPKVRISLSDLSARGEISRCSVTRFNDGKAIEGPSLDRAVIFQSHALLPWRSARDNVALGLGFRGMGRTEALEVADGWLGRLGLSGFGDRYPRHLLMQIGPGLGTLAMFLVGGGILAHGWHDVGQGIEQLSAAAGSTLQPVLGALLNMALGLLAGGAALLVVTLGQRLRR